MVDHVTGPVAALPCASVWSRIGDATLKSWVPLCRQSGIEPQRIKDAEEIASDPGWAFDDVSKIGLEDLIWNGVDKAEQIAVVFNAGCIVAGVTGLQADLRYRRMVRGCRGAKAEAISKVDYHGGSRRKSLPSGSNWPPSTTMVVPVM